MYAAKLQAENNKSRKELEDEKAKVVELGNDIDDQSNLLESTTNAQRNSRHRQELVLLLASHFQVKIIITICSFVVLFIPASHLLSDLMMSIVKHS